MNATGPRAGSADGPPASGDSRAGTNRDAPHRRELHEQIVRVLIIDKGLALERFADLEELAITFLTDGQRIEAQHRVDREVCAARLAAEHAHPPVGNAELVAPAWRRLMVEESIYDAVLHDVPVSGSAWAIAETGSITVAANAMATILSTSIVFSSRARRPEGRHYVWRDLQADLKVGTRTGTTTGTICGRPEGRHYAWRDLRADLKVGTTYGHYDWHDLRPT